MKPVFIIGAGLTGATIARYLAEEANLKVTILDKREHVAGNAHDQIDPTSKIRYHTYGPHLFHTNNMEVVKFLSKFTEWVPYNHRVSALLGTGEYVPFPPHIRSEVDTPEMRDKLADIFFRPYTKKMWGVELDDLDPSILKRVPIRVDDDHYGYFKDEFQALPKDGYTAMVENMLDHPNITLWLGASVSSPLDLKGHGHIFNSAPIDEWYDFKFGELPYRSIKFHHQHVMVPEILPTATVNYTNDGPVTRVTEWKNLPNHGDNSHMTMLTYEEPCDYKDNNHERYYPVKDLNGENRALYQKYKEHAETTDGRITFVGRCGQYVYIDMHQAVNMGLQHARKYVGYLV